jgi:thiopurine S-methyltransferase
MRAMDPGIWYAMWREGRIGFHEGNPNAHLVAQSARLAGRARVLVPLCGKSEDLAFLAGRGHEVVGIELVEDAVRAFFAEHEWVPEIAAHGPLIAYTAGPLTLWAGDLFRASAALVGACDAIYDRAALVAIPPLERPAYVAHLRSLAAPGAILLQITLERVPEDGAGPPFSAREAELRRLYAGCAVELLGEGPAARSRADGPALVERCFAIALGAPPIAAPPLPPP